jgi:hypothetical protein
LGKRSDKPRNERDFYPTPYKAVTPLFPFLPEKTWFAEPCAGNGALVDHLTSAGHKPYWSSDIHPLRDDVFEADANILTVPLIESDMIITNPPWDREILHAMITHFRKQNSAWLLLDADWCYTKQSSEYMKYCSMIVSIGRVKWVEGSAGVGKDNCAWYRFDQGFRQTIFVGR